VIGRRRRRAVHLAPPICVLPLRLSDVRERLGALDRADQERERRAERVASVVIALVLVLVSLLLVVVLWRVRS